MIATISDFSSNFFFIKYMVNEFCEQTSNITIRILHNHLYIITNKCLNVDNKVHSSSNPWQDK